MQVERLVQNTTTSSAVSVVVDLSYLTELMDKYGPPPRTRTCFLNIDGMCWPDDDDDDPEIAAEILRITPTNEQLLRLAENCPPDPRWFNETDLPW